MPPRLTPADEIAIYVAIVRWLLQADACGRYNGRPACVHSGLVRRRDRPSPPGIPLDGWGDPRLNEPLQPPPEWLEWFDWWPLPEGLAEALRGFQPEVRVAEGDSPEVKAWGRLGTLIGLALLDPQEDGTVLTSASRMLGPLAAVGLWLRLRREGEAWVVKEAGWGWIA